MSRLFLLASVLTLASARCLPTHPPTSPNTVEFPPIPADCPSTAVGCIPRFPTVPGRANVTWPACCVPDQGLMVLAQNWTTPGGYCSNPNLTCSDDTLRALPKNEWTLHGLWPDYCDGTYNTSPLGCDPPRRDVEAEKTVEAYAPEDLKAEMRRVWMSADGNYNWIWSHEWNKHGTCMSTINPTCFPTQKPAQDRLAYFAASLALRKRFDLFKIFSAHDIIPSETTTYSFSQFQAALKAEIGFEGALQCTKNNGTAYLREVWVYVRALPGIEFKNNEPVAPFSSCPKNGTIIYQPQKY
ncbi:ribonuclease T2-like protein [Powellomyces hirtus]|nr:ribonuclease T2-like protein [Powellomyces hirtus]